MANEEHLNILKQGVKEWNRWRHQKSSDNPDFRPDLMRRISIIDGPVFKQYDGSK